MEDVNRRRRSRRYREQIEAGPNESGSSREDRVLTDGHPVALLNS